MWFFQDGVDGKYHVAEPVTMTLEDKGLYHEPAAILGKAPAQQLMDDMWNAGIRPTNAQHSAELIDAMQGHIVDLRTIAFKGLKIERPA